MHIEEFGKPYQALPENPFQSEDNAEIALWKDARQWSRRFSYMLNERLSGEPLAESDVLPTLREFMSWHVRFSQNVSSHLTKKVEQDTSIEEWNSTLRFLRETHFHTMSFQMSTNWARLLSGHPMHKHEVVTSRNSVAYGGIGSLAVIAAAERSGEYFLQDTDGSALKDKDGVIQLDPSMSYFNSAANEADTAVVLQELTLREPTTIVVPAPGNYEHSKDGSLNIDFLVIDALRSQARGVQTKVSVSQQDKERYDPAYVTLVDGKRDLGNTKPIRLPKSTSTRTMSWPGLISAHHMLSQQQIFREQSQRGKAVRLGPRERELVRKRQEARFLTLNTRSFNTNASRFVTERVLHDMHADVTV